MHISWVALGMVLAPSSTVAPGLASGPRATLTLAAVSRMFPGPRVAPTLAAIPGAAPRPISSSST